jgi:WD40 repeat protein
MYHPTLLTGLALASCVCFAPLPVTRLTTLSGHQGDVECVAFSSDDRLIATSDACGTVRLWDIQRRKLLLSLEGRFGETRSLAFHPGANLLAIGDASGRISLWDVEKLKCSISWKAHDNQVESLSFAAKRLLASGGNDAPVRLWDCKSGKLVAELKGHKERVKVVVFSPDSSQLASGSMDGTVKLWDVSKRRELSTLVHTGFVLSIAYDSDAKTLLTGTGGDFSLLRGKPGKAISIKDIQTAVSSPGELAVWDLATVKQRCSIKMNAGYVTAISIAPVRSRYAWVNSIVFPMSGVNGKGRHAELHLRDKNDTESFCPPIRSLGNVTTVTFSRTGKWLAVGGSAGIVQVHEVQELFKARKY